MDADAHWESMSTVEEIGSALPPKVTGMLTTAPTTLHSGFQSKHWEQPVFISVLKFTGFSIRTHSWMLR